ncbi:hypothetical protein QN277_028551 [Acacia crassicarpa]|uniref:Uncharacterized protein n=1 Tax=Acacia crassicarpa TaxID=499986 RepID=A0AAE1MD87_9FABA|nr:hypothetical protein QN277_028551 [Acacia crassicarpa]
MAKSHESKPKSSLFLCCFGSFPHETSMRESDNKFSFQGVREQSSDSKTVPLGASLPEHDKEHRANRVRSRKWRWRLFFKSTSKSKSNNQKSLKESQTPATHQKPPRQRPPVVPVTPNQTPPQTRQEERAQRKPENETGLPRVASPQEDAREESISVPAGSHLVSLPAPKRRQSRLSSSTPGESQTTLSRADRSGNARKYESNDSAFGWSAVLVTLVILIVWGRLCAIPCTSAWLYWFPRIRKATKNDTTKNSNNVVSKDLDLDSEAYKKKVILEGLLERNHRVRHGNSGN